MNNKLEVIGIDHGWSMMKTVTQVFVTGVKEITTTPALFGDVLEYDGKYYKIGTVSLYIFSRNGNYIWNFWLWKERIYCFSFFCIRCCEN